MCEGLHGGTSSFQGVGIEGFHIQRCPHFRGLGFQCITTEVSPFQSWNKEVPLYTEVSSLQGVGIQKFHCIQRYPHSMGLE